MIKKISTMVCAAIMMLAMASCGSTAPGSGIASGSSESSQASGAGGGGSILGNLLGSLVSQAVPLTQKSLLGTWVYASPECRFTSEDALAQAGGAVAAATVDSKLAEIYARVGISATTFAVQFKEDNSCTIQIGGQVISGTYTLDTETRALKISSSTGLIKLTATVYNGIGQLTILFDADKLLSAVKMIAAATGKASSTLSTASGILQNYKGMMIGMNLTPYKE